MDFVTDALLQRDIDDPRRPVHLLVTGWRRRALQEPGRFGQKFSATVPRHGAVFLKVGVDGGHAALNGRRLEAFAAPSSYLVIDRVWRDGDRVDVALPMKLHAAPMPDNGKAGLDEKTLRAGPTKPRTVPEYSLEPIEVPTLTGSTTDPSQWLRRDDSPCTGAFKPPDARTP